MRGLRELTEFTYSLNGFINITEKYTRQNQHDFFFSISIFILPLPTRQWKKLFFPMCCTHSHCYYTQSSSFQSRHSKRLEKLYFRFSILSPGVVVYFRESIVFVFYFFFRERSLRATCWLAFNIFFLSSRAPTSALTYTRSEREREWRRKSEKLYTVRRWEGA